MINPFVETLIDKIRSHASGAGAALLQTPGDVLGSGWDTIAPGNVYVLGFNPGGRVDSDENSVARSLESTTSEPYSIYCDEVWPRDGKKAAGEHRHQYRVREYLAKLGEPDARKVAASNILFAKSPQASMSLKFDRNWLDICWEVHQYLLSEVRPRFILCLGNGEKLSAYNEVRRRSGWRPGPSDNFKACEGPDVVKTFKTSSATLFQADQPYPVQVIGVRHPSRFPTSEHSLKLLEVLKSNVLG